MEHLQIFVSLAKATDGGPATTQIIMNALKHKQIMFFAELLDLPSVQKLKGLPEFELLEIFAFGTYGDWIQRKDRLPALSEVHILKLRQLTVVQVAASSVGALNYADCQAATGIASVRDLEDLVISCVYANLIHARLDQRKLCIVVDWAIGRDTRLDALDPLLAKLDNWCANADLILTHLRGSIQEAEQCKDDQKTRHDMVKRHAEQIKAQVASESEIAFQGKQTSKIREAPSRDQHAAGRGVSSRR